MYLPHQRHSSIMRDRESLNQKEPWPFSFALRPFCSAKPAVVGRYLQYTDARLEIACELAISRGIKVPRYHHLKAILAANQDITYKEQLDSESSFDDSSMGYLRGSDYYREGGDPDAK